jgi:beta-lactamase regulating signal transducer with metallopeptidase domain
MDFAALQHSVFLQALGSAILNSLWQCFILWLIYEAISVSYKDATARFKNNLGTLLLFFSFAWFLTTFISKIFYQQSVAGVAALPTAFVSESHPGVHAVSGFSTFLSYASASLPYLSVAYIFLLFFLISRLFAAYRYVYFISNKRLVNPGGDLQLFTSKVAREIGIRKKISVWISHHIDVPATIGFIKPVILIPLASVNNLSSHQLEAIILHELAHIRRNDYITNLLISVIETILFFNPFVVLLSNIIKRERENCCDDFVLQYRYDPHSYASALLRLEQSRMSKLRLAIGAVSGKKQLLSRIKRITNSQIVSRQFDYGQKLMALLLVTAVICSVAWLAPEEKKSNPLVKVNKSVPPSNVRTADKVPQPAEAIVPPKQIENLPEPGINHISPKNELVTVPETEIENIPEDNFSGDDEKKDNPDFFKVENNIEPEAINLKRPQFFLDKTNINFPSFFNIQNFPFQNMNLSIDLGKIDMQKLNENLKQAYKQINTLDWNKVQNEIHKNFPKVKLSKPSPKELDALLEKAVLSKIDFLHDQQQQWFNSKMFEEQVQKEMLQQDSLHSAEVPRWNENGNKVQQIYKKIQRQYEKTRRNENDNYYFNYSVNAGAGDNDGETKAPCPQKAPAPSYVYKKGIKISIKRAPNAIHTGLLREKKPLQFSFYNADVKSDDESVISVELNDLP